MSTSNFHPVDWTHTVIGECRLHRARLCECRINEIKRGWDRLPLHEAYTNARVPMLIGKRLSEVELANVGFRPQPEVDERWEVQLHGITNSGAPWNPTIGVVARDANRRQVRQLIIPYLIEWHYGITACCGDTPIQDFSLVTDESYVRDVVRSVLARWRNKDHKCDSCTQSDLVPF